MTVALSLCRDGRRSAGEITLSGAILAIGGIKEKVLAARRSGVREVVLPEKNAANVEEDLPPHLREGLEFHFVHTIEEIVMLAVEPASRIDGSALTVAQSRALVLPPLP